MIKTPQQFTPIHDAEMASPRAFAEQVLKKMAQNANYLADLGMIGTVIYWQENAGSGIGTLDSQYWQRMDGSQITNPLSPLWSGILSKYVPDLRNKYPRCEYSPSGSSTGGSQVFNFNHDHGGHTGTTCPPIIFENDGDRQHQTCHSHTIAPALETDITLDFPAYVNLSAWMKIA